MPERDVAVAWVHSERVAHSWALSLMGIFTAEPRLGPPIPVRCGTDGLVAARNQGVQAFLNSDLPWLLWIDTDMGLKPDTATRLLEVADPVERPIVGALCFTNRWAGDDGYWGDRCVPVPTVFRWVTLPDGRNGFQPVFDYPRDALVEVAATGSACILIHRSVFEAMEPGTWYRKLTNPTTGDVIGEDLSFCYRAHQAGFRMYVHTGVRTTHLKPIWLQEADYDPAVSMLALGIEGEG